MRFCSNDLDQFAKIKTRQLGKPRGQISQTDEEGNSVEIWVKTWAEIIAECKSRLNFVQQHLQANVDKENSLNYLKKTYAKYLTGVVEDFENAPFDLIRPVFWADQDIEYWYRQNTFLYVKKNHGRE